jgi:cytochrome P450/NADPH-cytochrome P450 reductase
MLAEHTRCPMTKPKLLALLGDDPLGDTYQKEVVAKRLTIFDLLDEHPACELPFGIFLEMLSVLAPRYYSISSSPSVDPRRASITVSVVTGPARSGRGIYKGSASNYLANRKVGDVIHAVVRETKAGFRLPADPSVPIIMIGPGTGLAPFRGFLQERAAQHAGGAALGPALLFFGCRDPQQDFLYEDELKGFAHEGIVALHVAFSRSAAEKVYVQHLIAQQSERVWALLQQGAIVYVCGDGSKMEPDVKATLLSLYRANTGGDDAAAQRWIEQLGAANRYVLDVWAGG